MASFYPDYFEVDLVVRQVGRRIPRGEDSSSIDWDTMPLKVIEKREFNGLTLKKALERLVIFLSEE